MSNLTERKEALEVVEAGTRSENLVGLRRLPVPDTAHPSGGVGL